MQQLSEALVAALPPETLLANTPVQAVQRQDRGWVVSAGYASDHFDSVIVATPAHAAVPLLEITCNDLAAELKSISYSSSMTVALGFDKEVRSCLPPGFGFLVPRREGKRMLAATFVHNKFPHRAPEDRALLRCFLGGSRDEQVLQLTHDEVLSIVREELRQIIGLKAEPLFSSRLSLEECDGPIYGWPPGSVAKDRESLEGMARSGSGGQCLSRNWRPRLCAFGRGGGTTGFGGGSAAFRTRRRPALALLPTTYARFPTSPRSFV